MHLTSLKIKRQNFRDAYGLNCYPHPISCPRTLNLVSGVDRMYFSFLQITFPKIMNALSASSQRHRLLARSNFTFTTPCLNLTHPPSPSKIVHCKIFPFQRQHWKAWKIKIHEMYTVQEIMSDWFTAYILGKCRSGEL